ncbi:MAG: DNA-3-methyladenine glycosylase I [Bacillota bacterium]|nr:DNA-3-methyladenine glycosylase I [Bacillota bacterium]
MLRCPWCGDDPLYVKYHDEEWGVPVYSDQRHFEFLVLESAQAGLSWLTILRRREDYRRIYEDFDPFKVARFDDTKIEEMMQDKRIIRNRLKIESSINNARRYLEVCDMFGSFSNYLWNFVDGKPLIGHWEDISEIPAQTSLSEQMSRDLKKRGFKFIGPTIIYSHLQATGLINDHLVSCFRYQELVSHR